MILACQNINKAFGSRELLKNASFHIEEREKTAIVGINGVGKSTLLKIIMKEIDADSGEVVIAKGKSIETIADELEEDISVIEPICKIAEQFSTDYDSEQIYEQLK